ncbi:hypothetical protein [Borrelia puertoricensis]|nr:hypothetical protein bpuSUM_001807 [Borrelia puertoricensis]
MLGATNAVGIGVDSLVKEMKGIVDVVFKEKGNSGADPKDGVLQEV